MTNPRLGRLPDPTHPLGVAKFPVKTEFPIFKPHRSQIWCSSETLDQWQSPACVGFSAATNLITHPVKIDGITNKIGDDIYRKAQTLDPWSNTSHEGSTITAGMQACMELFPGVFECYRWATTLDEMIQSVGYLGPMIMGTDWIQSMFYPDPKSHRISVNTKTHHSGGHAYLICAVNVEDRTFTIHNTWGNDWGKSGLAYISFEDLEYLLKSPFGQAMVPLGKHRKLIS